MDSLDWPITYAVEHGGEPRHLLSSLDIVPADAGLATFMQNQGKTLKAKVGNYQREATSLIHVPCVSVITWTFEKPLFILMSPIYCIQYS